MTGLGTEFFNILLEAPGEEQNNNDHQHHPGDARGGIAIRVIAPAGKTQLELDLDVSIVSFGPSGQQPGRIVEAFDQKVGLD